MVGFLKFFRVTSVIILTVVVLMGCQNQDDDVITIGITQIVEHPALNRNREGFIKGLESRGFVDGENIDIDVKVAQGDMANAQLIASGFVSDDVDLMMAIATPSAQAAKNATIDHQDIPVLFSAVTDPKSAGLVDSLELPGGNVTGTSDLTPISKQFDLIKQLFPNKTTIGIIYNTGESNSEIQVNLAKSLAKEKGLTIIEKGITTSNEIQDALNTILPDVDLLYIPTDNTVASAMPVVISKTNELGIPVIGSEKAHVESGALITEGIDYFELGFQTGLMAADILEGKNPKSMSVQSLENTSLVINLDAAKVLGITIPESFIERAQIIESGE